MSDTQPKYTFEQILNSEKFQLSIKKVLPEHVTPDRIVTVALNALNRTPELRECTQESFFIAFRRLTEIGLEPDGYNAHLIPFNNKIKGTDKYRKEVQLIVDYKGLVSVIRRNPLVSVVKGAVVRKGDDFYYEEGDQRRFKHIPRFTKTDEVLGAYSFVKFKDGDWEMDFVPKWRIDEVRSRSRAKDRGPWVTDWDEMALKTALRHHSKTLPLSPKEREIITADDDQFEYEPPVVRKAEFKSLKRQTHDEPKQEPEGPEAEEPTQGGVEEEVKPGTSTVVIEKLLAKDGVTDAEVIGSLIEKKLDIGDANETMAIEDLPEQTKDDVIAQWSAILVSIAKRREKEKGK